MKVHQAIAKALADHGVDTIFGLIGDGNLYMADSFVRDCGGSFVAAAHEAGAVLMALGYASVSGKVGVATVTHGPALTNTVTALAEGAKARMPMVLLCGDTRVEDRDGFQVIAQREVVAATGAGFEQLRAPDTVAQDVATAFRRAVLERRPIALNMPIEFQWLETDYKPLILQRADTSAIVPESDDLDNAIGIIAAAKRPVIVAGKGANRPEARAALLRLAARIEAPVATTLKAKGFFGGEAFNLGVCGTLSTSVAAEILLESDCLIAFGAGLNKFTLSSGALAKGRRIVQIDLDPAAIGRQFPVDAGVFGDVARTADLFVHWLDEAEIPGSGYRDAAMQARLNDYSAADDFDPAWEAGDVDLREVMLRINRALPADRIFVGDGGRYIGQAWRQIDIPGPSSFVHTVNFGAIGCGMAYAIGAGRAAPGRPIALFTGDGGFMLGGLGEFNTAVRDGTDLIVILCNDGAYGAEHIQFRNKGMDPSISTFDWPDLAAVATSLGGRGYSVRSLADLDTALAALPDRDRPVLIDIKLDPDTVPQLH
jgi:acetolactate synthase-1/2/3 large subunit